MIHATTAGFLATIVPLATPVNDPPSSSTVGDEGDAWLDLDREIASLNEAVTQGQNGIRVSGFLRMNYMYSEDEAFTTDFSTTPPTPGDNISGFNLLNARLDFDGEVGDYAFHLSLDGGDALDGTDGEFEIVDAYGVRSFYKGNIDVLMGRFKQPALYGALVSNRYTLFFERSINAEEVDDRELGVKLVSRLGKLELSSAVQNGVTGSDSSHQHTHRAVIDLLGDPFDKYQGSYDAAPGMNFGLAVFFADDDGIKNGNYWGAEGEFNQGAVTLHGDVIVYDEDYDSSGGATDDVDNDDFFNFSKADTNPFTALLSFLIGEDYEIAARYADFDDSENTWKLEIGLNWYQTDRATWKLVYTNYTSDDNEFEGDSWEVGYTLLF